MSKPVFSLSAFRDFCLSKNPDEEYEWYDRSNCAVGQYGVHLGIGDKIWDTENPKSMENIRHMNHVAMHYPRTFGALAGRLEYPTTYLLQNEVDCFSVA